MDEVARLVHIDYSSQSPPAAPSEITEGADPLQTGAVRAGILVGNADSTHEVWLDATILRAENLPQWIDFDEPEFDSAPVGVLTGSGIFFMRSWDEPLFRQYCEAACAAASPAPDWHTLADRLARQFAWYGAMGTDEERNRAAGIAPSEGFL